MSVKFKVQLLDEDNEEDIDNGVTSGSLFNIHRSKIQTNILQSKSPKKQTDKTDRCETPVLKGNGTCDISENSEKLHLQTISVGKPGSNLQCTSNIKQQGSCIKSELPSVIDSKSRNSENTKAQHLSTVTGSRTEASSSVSLSPVKLGGTSKASLIISARQRGNPIIKFIRNVPWEYGDIVPDYEMGKTMCALYLSIRYHHLNPQYIHERLKQLGRSYDLRVLLVQVDVKDPHHSLTELAKISILSDVTLIVAFSQEEAGRYLETYKAYENKPPDLIMEKTEGDFLSQFTDCITCTRKVNKTDAMTLLTKFGSFENVVQADEEDLSLCPGFGPQKAKRLHQVLQEPFIKPKKKTKNDTNILQGSSIGTVGSEPSTSGIS